MTETIDPDRQLRHFERAAAMSGVAIETFVVPMSRHVLAGDIRLHYLDWGGVDASHVVFLHGGGLTAHTWDLACLALRRDLHCLALDQRGHGNSEWSAGMCYSAEAYARDVELFADALGLERFVIVGMSLGGITALEFARRHPERLEKMVLVDVGPDLQPAGQQRISEFMSHPGEFASVEEFVERAMRFNGRRDRELLRTSLLHNLRQLPNGRWTWKYDRRHHGELHRESMQEARLVLAEHLPQIKCPTLVIRGGESDVFSDENAEALVARLPDARWLKIRHAGHTVQGDNPKDFIAALRSFLVRDPIP